MKTLRFIIILLMFLAGFFFLSWLPMNLPVHWNFRGEVDGLMPKVPGAFLLPILAALIAIGFEFIPQIDPKKQKYRLFSQEWEIIKTGFTVFLAYMEFVTFYLALNPAGQIMPLVFIGIAGLFILLGNYLSKIRQNYFIGIKTPWSLTSEDNWNKTHRFASWCFVIAGIVILVEVYFIWYAPVIVFGSIILSTILPVIYSYLLHRRMLA